MCVPLHNYNELWTASYLLKSLCVFEKLTALICIFAQQCLKECEESTWTKPGDCPGKYDDPDPCMKTCDFDSQCPGTEKCCPGACGSICRSADIPNSLAGKHFLFFFIRLVYFILNTCTCSNDCRVYSTNKQYNIHIRTISTY